MTDIEVLHQETSGQPQALDPERSYEPRYPASEMGAATYAELTAGPKSPVAIECCRELLEALFSRATDTSSRQKLTRKTLMAFGALVADLLERDPDDDGGWLYRSTAAGSFSGDGIGYRPFIAAYGALASELVEEVKGNRVWMASAIVKSGRVPAGQRATRFRATPALRAWFAERGIDRANWTHHFTRSRTLPQATKGRCPIILRAGKPPRRFGVRVGRNLPIDKVAPVPSALIAQMERVNEYLARQEVAPYGPVFLRRVFSCGDTPGHGWSQGGRLYAIGSEPYQLAKKVHRRNITINGQATVELDIQASHLMILAGLGHIPRPNGDPYDLEGLPRPIVKKWVQMTLSHGKRHTRWPTGAVEDLVKEGFDVKADYPLAETGNAILKHLPILKDDGSPAVSTGWGELQYRESEVILATMERLAFGQDIPALPVHDSLIVPRGAEMIARRVLGMAFRDAFGIDAVIE